MSAGERAAFDNRVRLHVYRHFVEKGRPPAAAETAQALSSSAAKVRAAYRRLAEGRVLVLHEGSDDILMAEPFSVVPTSFHVQVGKRFWWGNCIWDALGIPAMLKQDARVVTACGCCNSAMSMKIENSALAEAPGVIHFVVPARDWWKDVVFT